MGCVVYRKGTGTVEHGVECESAICEIEYLEGMLNGGWSLNPPGYEPKKIEYMDDEEPEINPVRLTAKEKGIEGWDTKRIATLEKMLEA